jgi:hypothetical protein
MKPFEIWTDWIKKKGAILNAPANVSLSEFDLCVCVQGLHKTMVSHAWITRAIKNSKPVETTFTQIICQ